MAQSLIRPLVALFVLVLAFALLSAPLILAAPAQAQGGSALAYGESVTGQLTTDAPLALYRFTGTAGDLIFLDALRTGGPGRLRLTVLGPDQQTLGTGSAAGLVPDGPDAHLALVLPASGSFTVLVGSTDDSPAAFVLRLDTRPAIRAQTLRSGVLQQVAPSDSPQYFTLDSAACPITLIASTRPGPEGAPVIGVRGPAGRLIALWSGAQAHEHRVTIDAPTGAASGLTLVEIAPLAPDQGTLTLLADCADRVPGSSAATRPPTVTPAATPDAVIYPANCGPFRLASPREGLPNGPVTVYWAAAPNAAAYRVNILNDAGDLLLMREVKAPADSLTLDVSTAAVGPGFYFTVEVVAVDGLGRPACADGVLQGREMGAPAPGS